MRALLLPAWCGLVLCAASAAWADVVVMTNGDRIEGEVVSETPSEVSIRRAFGTSGKIEYVQTLRRANILRIEKAPAGAPTTEAAVPPTSRPEDIHAAQAIADKPAFLKAALGKWRSGNAIATGADLTRLITQSTPDELAGFSKDVQQELSMSLADLAAQAHWTAATERNKGRPIHLPNVTQYELPSLVPQLTKAYDAALQEEAKIKPPEPRLKPGLRAQTQPATAEPADPTASAPAEGGTGLTIAAWIDKPNEFEADKPKAAALLGQIQYASSLLAERMRLDPEVKTEKTLKTALTGQRIRLAALMKAVSIKASGTPPAEKKPAPREAEERKQPQPRMQQMRMQPPPENDQTRAQRAMRAIMDKEAKEAGLLPNSQQNAPKR